MPNGNPFFIQPAQYGPALAGLGQTIAGVGQVMRERRAQEKEQERQQVMLGEINTAVESGNLDNVADVLAKYPDMQAGMRQNLLASMNIRGEAAEKRMKDDTFEILNNPGNAEQILERRITQGEAEGRDMSDTRDELESFRQNPQAALQQTEAFAATAYPEYKQWASVMRQKDEEKKPLQRGEGALVFDPNTGTFSVDPVAKKYLQEKAAEKAVAGSALSAKDRQGINKDVTGLIKDSVGINRAAKDLSKLRAGSSPTDQLAAIFKFMKALDPTSVVREGEQQMARSTGGPADAFVGYINQIRGEGALPPDAFQNMVNTAINLSDSAVDSANEEMSSYLDAYEETLPESFKNKLKARVPKRIGVGEIPSIAPVDQGVFRAPPQPMDPTERARRAQTGTAQVKPQQFTSSGGIQFTVRGQ